jgi:hypothetical protein
MNTIAIVIFLVLLIISAIIVIKTNAIRKKTTIRKLHIEELKAELAQSTLELDMLLLINKELTSSNTENK